MNESTSGAENRRPREKQEVGEMTQRRAARRALSTGIAIVSALAMGCPQAEVTTKDSRSGETAGAYPAQPTAQRIVSLSALATRFIFDLGVGDRLVGIDEDSAAWVGSKRLPIVDLGRSRSLAPDLVLLKSLADLDPRSVFDLEADGVRIVEFDPHDLEDVGALCRALGTQLVGVAAAAMFERRIMRPLALVGGASPPFGRLRVVAVVDLDPLTLAGGHSFETDLIEIGGGTSLTHGGEESRIVMTPGRWRELEPDLVIVTSPEEATPAQRIRARALIPDRYRIEFFHFDRETFWLHAPEEDAERMRALIAKFSNEETPVTGDLN